jgi:CO/xanthine dehydrogenase FAD-binding subunit
MAVFVPRSLAEAFAALEEAPDAQLLAGGTDFMVEVNYGHRHPSAVVALGQVPELKGWYHEGDDIVLGAGLTYTEMLSPALSGLVPGLAQAARTVGSPQIRNAGTLGGNLATASPAGDTLPILSALGASVTIGRSDGSRRSLGLDELITGPKATVLRPGEIVLDARVPARGGRQEFLKVGTRNAMVIAVASAAVVVDFERKSVRVALGSVGPVVIRAREAEHEAERLMDWDERRLTGHVDRRGDFGELVKAAVRPIDDHRSTAAYRRHAAGVCAVRGLMRAVAPLQAEEAA